MNQLHLPVGVTEDSVSFNMHNLGWTEGINSVIIKLIESENKVLKNNKDSIP